MDVRLRRSLVFCIALAAFPGTGFATTFRGVSPPSALSVRPGPTHPVANVRRRMVASLCTTTGIGAFVGAGTGNVAGGTYTGFVAGEYNQACDQLSLIGAGGSNTIYGNGSTEAQESFIGAGDSNTVGNYSAFVGAGNANTVFATHSFIGAGESNEVAAPSNDGFIGAGANVLLSGPYAFDGAGYSNGVSGYYAFVGSGLENYANGSGSFVGAGGSASNGSSVSGSDSFVGAGDQNTIDGNESFVGAGVKNTVSATDSVIDGGYLNDIGATASFSVIAGGNNNGANGEYAVVGGGYDNLAKGADAVIAGGQRNEAFGELSFAAGYQAHALNTGSFVWSDYKSGSSALADTAADQFVVRASGGTYVYSSENDTTGVKLAAGSGTWSNLSDRNVKTDIVPLDDATILAKVAALPLSTWRYKAESGVRHVGPMAQDFYAAFRVGEDDRHITSIDEDGVALAAVKAVHVENGTLRRENARMALRLAAVEARNAALEKKVDALVARAHT